MTGRACSVAATGAMTAKTTAMTGKTTGATGAMTGKTTGATGAMTGKTTGATGATTGKTTGATSATTGKTVVAAGPGCSGNRELDDQAARVRLTNLLNAAPSACQPPVTRAAPSRRAAWRRQLPADLA
jgi:hypothetical protein